MQNIATALSRGSLVLMRDYAVGDLAEERLKRNIAQKCLGNHFFVRGDGTRAFYFDEVERLFVTSIHLTAGPSCDAM